MPPADFELGPIRPPDEAQSLLIRTTRGCPWNRCRYCTLFKGMKFSIRKTEAIKKDILAARKHYENAPFETCFLQDGDSFAMKTRDLIEVLTTLKQAFPTLKRISSYGRAQTMGRKSEAELKEIRQAGLNMLYCGVESGSNPILTLVNKGVTAEKIRASAVRAKRAGMSVTVFVILGLGGKAFSRNHAMDTAKLLNQINPDKIRIMTLAVKPGTGLDDLVKSHEFTLISEIDMIQEQRLLVSNLKGIQSRYENYHGVNLLTELQGDLPKDQARFIRTMDRFLSMDPDIRANFILGRRLRYYSSLSDLANAPAFDAVQRQLEKINRENKGSFDGFCHQLRCHMI